MLLPLSARAGSETDLAHGREADQRLDVYYPDRCLAATWEQAGAVVVTLNYRLTPDVVHPGHVQDVAAGIAWTRANIGRYDGDQQRLFLLGHSDAFGTDPAVLRAHAAIARDLADADSHLARDLMRFVGLQ